MIEVKSPERTSSLSRDGISLPEIISSLSFALDLTEGAVHGHAVRSCLIGMRIAQSLRLSPSDMFDLYYALLLKDIGCSSNAARMCQIVGGDDRAMKAGVKLVDWTTPRAPSREMLQLLWKNVLPESDPIKRIAHIVRMGQQTGTAETMVSMRCERGAQIMTKLGFGRGASEAVRRLDERWDGTGYPDRLSESNVPLLARIVALAQHLDVFGTGETPEIAIGVMHVRSGRWFDPELVRVADDLHNRGALWLHCKPEDNEDEMHRAVVEIEPGSGVHLDGEEIDRICEAFADVVDAKSPYTFRHSVGVTNAAVMIAESMCLAPKRVDLVRRAALLHDIGKLSISNSILDKPGSLNAQEWIALKDHPIQSRRILERVSAFAELAEVAGQHHERLDGSGYPDKLMAADLSIESRIVAVADVYGALSEDRPYRPGLKLSEIVKLMRNDVPHRLDGDCFDALLAGLAEYSSGSRTGSSFVPYTFAVPDPKRMLGPKSVACA